LLGRLGGNSSGVLFDDASLDAITQFRVWIRFSGLIESPLGTIVFDNLDHISYGVDGDIAGLWIDDYFNIFTTGELVAFVCGGKSILDCRDNNARWEAAFCGQLSYGKKQITFQSRTS
jgi:hypothetical protein